jgi:nitrate/TMAO reductase-like tetraheme cytochrome c subunit
MSRLLVLAALVAGCRVAPPQATAVDAERAHVALTELERGRSLLLSKCGGSCHAAPLPSQHTAAEWPAKLDEMSGRAGLQPVQRHLIEEYLVAMARAR